MASKVQNLAVFLFLVKLHTNPIKFHIFVMICEFCYILQNML